jgi:aryl sulfotransferase
VSLRVDASNSYSDAWSDFELRADDIVICTYPKSGTTWVQMICALLIFQDPELPAPLAELSPWLDHQISALRDEARARLNAQGHRRFIKTHAALDLVPADPRVTYLVTARHPLDMSVSMAHQFENLDHRRIERMAGRPMWKKPPNAREGMPRPPLRDLLMSWIDNDGDKNSLRATLNFFSVAWERRAQSNVAFVHYNDLSDDLAGEMRRLAEVLGISVPEPSWPDLVEAATFTSMRNQADRLIPDPENFRDPKAFFHTGGSGSWHDHLSPDDYAHYRTRAATLAPADLLTWLHRDD